MSYFLSDYKENQESLKIAVSDSGDNYYLNKGKLPTHKYRILYNDYKKDIAKLFVGRQKQLICDTVEKILNNGEDVNKYPKNVIDFYDIVKEREDKKKTLYVEQDNLYPC